MPKAFNLLDYLATILGLEKDKAVLSEVLNKLEGERVWAEGAFPILESETQALRDKAAASQKEFDSKYGDLRSYLKKEASSWKIILIVITGAVVALTLWLRTVSWLQWTPVWLQWLPTGALTLITVASIFDGGQNDETALKQHESAAAECRSVRGAYEQKASELALAKRILEDDETIPGVRAQLESTRDSLGRLYSLGIVYPKYRTLQIIATLFEYLESGRCAELKGHEGAYNLLEHEIRLDRIVVKQEEILAKLEEIERNQYLLYSALTEINRSVDQLLVRVDNMQEMMTRHNQIVEYNTARAANAARGVESYLLWRDLFRA